MRDAYDALPWASFLNFTTSPPFSLNWFLVQSCQARVLKHRSSCRHCFTAHYYWREIQMKGHWIFTESLSLKNRRHLRSHGSARANNSIFADIYSSREPGCEEEKKQGAESIFGWTQASFDNNESKKILHLHQGPMIKELIILDTVMD